jgi:hypothetical protein
LIADSGARRPFRDDAAHPFRLIDAHHSGMMPPGVAGMSESSAGCV